MPNKKKFGNKFDKDLSYDGYSIKRQMFKRGEDQYTLLVETNKRKLFETSALDLLFSTELFKRFTHDDRQIIVNCAIEELLSREKSSLSKRYKD